MILHLGLVVCWFLECLLALLGGRLAAVIALALERRIWTSCISKQSLRMFRDHAAISLQLVTDVRLAHKQSKLMIELHVDDGALIALALWFPDVSLDQLNRF